MASEYVPNVIVVGAGGVGVICALSLCTKGKTDVSLVVRSDFNHVQEKGYQIDSCNYGKLDSWRPHHIFKTTEDAASDGKFFDYILIATKNIPDGPVHSRVENIVKPLLLNNHSIDVTRQSNILLVQNGIDIEKSILEIFDQKEYNYTILSGIEIVGSTKIATGTIHQIGTEKIFVGAFQPDDNRAKEAAKQFVDMYVNEGQNAGEFDPRVRHSRWNKLLYNAAINTTTALIGLDVPRALQFGVDGKSTEFEIFRPAMNEIIKIAASEGIILDEAYIDIFTNISRNLLFKPSMCVDREKGQLMELEVILGNPIGIAKKNGVETPVLSNLYFLLVMLQGKLKEANGLINFDEETCRIVN
ncbi:similar to Saccharomyces cerevisiae YDL144C Putative protein of unknown function [Maudiozyma barnettii]|uniref:2-dehydropantoate 2-reductase n=1 Tax=Maudiozyma barnettii TaxID=61262 RepID=A0A8H2VBJ2_9SACH|nr:hypothetical protein [Kazachstania barnettii]CAB4252207.1 similar to Saccharomyces cerevisiae YDL144C Putative protein of unknown function [Kazachstania barnettii]CAD1778833.1 similar to Saccharomyces cerevisiae YDL144C Putative protein of unknown function [Kazachstania barnettii]